MSSTNLAICFAPSLLEPDFSLSVIKNEAPMLVDFMITHAPEIYNREMPDLFKQLTSQEERDVRYVVPLKDEDDTEMSEGGGYYSSRHTRNNSLDMCTSASEDSLDEDEMTPRHVTLLHTSSDSNVTDIYNSNNKSGRVTLLSDRSEEVSTGIEGDQSDMDEEEYDDDYNSQRQQIQQSKFLRARHGSGENSGGRRRTIGTQSSIKNHFSPDLSSSHGPPKPRTMGYIPSYSPNTSSQYPDSMDSDQTSFNRSESGGKQGHKKKRKKAGHSNSFTKSSDLHYDAEPKIPQSSSLSFGYESLSPGDRPRSRSIAATAAQGTHVHEDMLTKSLEQSLPHTNSNLSISSRTSGSSNGSQTQSRGTQTRTEISPQLKTSRSRSQVVASTASDHVKPEEYRRLRLLSNGVKPSSGTGQGGGGAPLLYDSDVSQDTLIPVEDYDTQQKMNRVTTDDHTHRGDGYHGYQPSQPSEPMKRMESVETTTSIDDRPEAERHLSGGGSLPRTGQDDYKHLLSTGGGSLGRKGPFNEIMPLGNFTSEGSTGSRLTIISGGGYNSDTESSPSRTLNRQDKKLEEVSSPQNLRSSIPNKYHRQVDVGDNRLTSSLEKNKGSYGDRGGRSSTGSDTRRPNSTTTPEPTSSSQTKKNRLSTYDVYQKLYEKESISNKSVVSPTNEDDNKKLSSSFDSSSSPKEEHNVDNTGSRILSVSKDNSKSRSMPDYAKRMSRTVTSSTVKTVKVVRYDLPTPKRIRRINLRAYSTNK